MSFNNSDLIRVALVGCGKIADSHAEQIHRIEGAEIVAVCDREQLMADQFCARYNVARSYTDLSTLLQEARPAVVHITTPPQSHYQLGTLALRHGCHIYVEKPFTVEMHEACELVDLASATKRILVVGHDAQFSHAAIRMREAVSAGYLGGPPVHLESYYGYPLCSGAYAAALLGDRDHWVRRLPGRLLQNTVSHVVASVAEFLVSDDPDVLAIGFCSDLVKRFGANDVVDELRVIITDPQGPSAYITFSSQMRPALHQLRVYGPSNGLIVDDDKQLLLRLRGEAYKSYLEKFVPPIGLAMQCLSNAVHNVRRFVANDFRMKSGLRTLISRTYDAIRRQGPPPVPYREVLRTSRIVDSIVRQVHDAERHLGDRAAPDWDYGRARIRS